MRPAGARASNPPTVQTGLWADLGPKSAEQPPKHAPPRRPETLAEENARLRARVASLEAVAERSGPARRCEAAQLPACSCAAAPHVARRLEQHRATILGLETLVERQARALDATDADGASTEEILDRLARALRGVADLGNTAPYHEDAPRGAEAPASPFQSSLLRTVEALRGRAGSPVRVDASRGGQKLSATLTRAQLDTSAPEVEVRGVFDGTGVLAVRSFSGATPDAIEQGVTTFR